MKYYESMKDLVGNTPMVKLLHAGAGLGSEIFAK
ncbi:MAG TPA: cysteine synthase, partial [Lachnospiraceae bacterium]|nr:cysteine synthase [Lachnospiraceae bacterium]